MSTMFSDDLSFFPLAWSTALQPVSLNWPTPSLVLPWPQPWWRRTADCWSTWRSSPSASRALSVSLTHTSQMTFETVLVWLSVFLRPSARSASAERLQVARVGDSAHAAGDVQLPHAPHSASLPRAAPVTPSLARRRSTDQSEPAAPLVSLRTHTYPAHSACVSFRRRCPPEDAFVSHVHHWTCIIWEN